MGDRKAYGIPVAADGEMGTGDCISKVAEFPYVGVGGP